jgi:uncharacterized OsmC-like protein
MAEQLIVDNVSSSSTNVFGRTLNSARMHHFVIDGTTEPKEEVTSVEAFLAGISSCAVHLVERFARETGVRLTGMRTEITGTRAAAEPERFQHVELRFEMIGPTQQEAEALAERFKGR